MTNPSRTRRRPPPRADLLAERIDLAIRAGQTLEPTLVARRIGAGQQTLVAGPAYLRAHGTPRSRADQPPPDSAETARGGVRLPSRRLPLLSWIYFVFFLYKHNSTPKGNHQ